MTSNQKTNCTNLSKLEHDMLVALTNNDDHSVSNFGAQLSQLLLEVEEAISTDSLTQEQAKAHFTLSHNLYITSTQAQQIHLVMDELCENFSQRLNVLTPLTANTLPPSSPPLLSTNESVIDENSDSSTSHTILKNWSQTRLTYLFPSPLELKQLASQTSMSECKVNSWFRNARSRSGWAKLYALKPHVNKDQEKLQSLIDEYQSLKRLNTPEEFKQIVAGQEPFQLLDKIFGWFATTKPIKQTASTSSVRPWVKEVLSNTLASFRQGAAGVLDSSKQLLPSFYPKSTNSSPTTASSPAASSSNLTTSSSPSACTAPTSVASSRSDRSDSLDISSRPQTSSSSSSRLATSSLNLPPTISSTLDSICTDRPADSPDCFSNPSTSSLNPAISSSLASSELLSLSNPACHTLSAQPLNSSSSRPTWSTSSNSPAILPSNLPAAPSSFPNPWYSSRPADLVDSSSRPSSSSSLPTSVISFTTDAPALAALPNSTENIRLFTWVNPLDPHSSHSSRSSSMNRSGRSHSNLFGATKSFPSSQSSSPGGWSSPHQSPFVSPIFQPSQLPLQQLSQTQSQPPLQFLLPQTREVALTILSSSPTEFIADERPSSFDPTSCSPFSKKSQQSCLSGQFDDAPEDA